jgi:hypothetical protein
MCGAIDTIPRPSTAICSRSLRAPPYHIFGHTKADCPPGEDCVAYSFSPLSGECKRL